MAPIKVLYHYSPLHFFSAWIRTSLPPKMHNMPINGVATVRLQIENALHLTQKFYFCDLYGPYRGVEKGRTNSLQEQWKIKNLEIKNMCNILLLNV